MLQVPYFKVKTVNYIFMKWVGTYKKKNFFNVGKNDYEIVGNVVIPL